MNIKEMIDEFLVCPKCKGELELVKIKEKSAYQPNGLMTADLSECEVILCRVCGVYYPIEDDMPILLIDEAKTFKS
jgi:uncharacterized protein YbaR (Trm112 family)